MIENLFYCTRDTQSVVLEQSRSCIEMCGNQKGKRCKIGCMEHIESVRGKSSAVLYNRKVFDHFYDILFIQKQNFEHTILVPAVREHVLKFTDIDFSRLTKRECQIAHLINSGFSNEEIRKKLCISSPTLKTHINHIYQKSDARPRRRT